MKLHITLFYITTKFLGAIVILLGSKKAVALGPAKLLLHNSNDIGGLAC